jgi:hypothetical protein
LPEEFLSEFKDPRVCIHAVRTALITCDERIEGGLCQAQQCTLFETDVDVESIKTLFKADLEGSSLVEVAGKYPDAAALMWVLGSDRYQDLNLELDDDDEEEDDEE